MGKQTASTVARATQSQGIRAEKEKSVWGRVVVKQRRTLKQMLESSEEEVEQTFGQADQAGSEGDPVASTQIEGHEEDNPDFDLSPL